MCMNNEIWQQWLANFKWIAEISEKCRWHTFKSIPVTELGKDKGWDVHQLEVKPAVEMARIKDLEKATNQTYPDDFKLVMARYSSGVHLNWHMGDSKVAGFDDVFCGCGYGYIWDFEVLEEVYKDYVGWITDCWTDPSDDYGGVYYDKVPFISVPNGDLIAFSKTIVNGCSEVIYLSHDDGRLHGQRLARTFVEFISRWSNIGCVGPEDWQIVPFYDFERRYISFDSPSVLKWKSLLNQ